MQILFYFFVYALGGWLLEGTFNLVTTGSFSKDNFLKLPIKPMYGISMVLLILTANTFPNWLAIAFGSLIIPTVIEFTTGTLLEVYTARKWWDYSSSKYNLGGHICLTFSFSWMILSILVIYFVHPIIATVYFSVENLCIAITTLLLCSFVFDSIFSIIRLNGKRVS